SLAPTICRRTTKQQMPAVLRGALLVSRGNELIQVIQILLAPDTFEPGIKCGQVVEIQRDEPTANVSGDERQATLWVDKPLFHKGFGRQFLLVSLPAGQCWLLCSVRTNGQDAHATLERGQRHLVRWRLAGWHVPLCY